MEEDRAAEIAQLKKSQERLEEQMQQLMGMVADLVSQKNKEGVSGSRNTDFPEMPEHASGFESGKAGANQETVGTGNTPPVHVQMPFISAQQPILPNDAQPFIPQSMTTPFPAYGYTLGNTSSNPVVISEEEEAKKAKMHKYQQFEERLRAVESQKIYGANNAVKLELVSDLVIPHKFKAPEFDKYNGVTDPQDHLLSYVRKMSPYTKDDKMMIHFFQYSLSGSASRWYNQLDGHKIKCWPDLVVAFTEHYQYMADLAPDRTTLENMERKPGESFKEYARRWREVASQASPSIDERELSLIFLKTLKPHYIEKLLPAAARSFTELVMTGEALDAVIKSGIIDSGETSSVKKGQNSTKEKEVQATIACNPYQSPYPQVPYMYSAYYPPYNHSYYHSYRPHSVNVPQAEFAPRSSVSVPKQPIIPVIANQITTHNRPVKEKTHIDPIPIAYTDLFPQLVEHQMITPVLSTKQYEPPYPKWYDVNATCAYHSGAKGHTTENCITLKYKVQGLINSGRLSFDSSAAAPNPANNSEHNATMINDQ